MVDQDGNEIAARPRDDRAVPLRQVAAAAVLRRDAQAGALPGAEWGREGARARPSESAARCRVTAPRRDDAPAVLARRLLAAACCSPRSPPERVRDDEADRPRQQAAATPAEPSCDEGGPRAQDRPASSRSAPTSRRSRRTSRTTTRRTGRASRARSRTRSPASSASRRARSSGRSCRSTPPTSRGSKDFDFDVNQISITPQRARAVDFSDPYYTSPQAVIAQKKSAGRQGHEPRRARGRPDRRPDRHHEPRRGDRLDQADQAAEGVRRLERGRDRAQAGPGRRRGGRPADRAVPDRRARSRAPRSSASSRRPAGTSGARCWRRTRR